MPEPPFEDLKRIAILGSRGFPSTYGGYETFVRHVARDWCQKGHHVSVYSRDYRKGYTHWTEDGVHVLWTPGVDTQSLSTLSFGLSSQVHASFQHFDAILVLNIANGLWLPILRASGTPIVVNTDGIEWKRKKWGSLARKMFYWGATSAAHYADVLVADSRAIADIWRHEFAAESLFIPYGADIHHGVDTNRIEQLGLVPRTYVLAVARLAPENNIDLLLDAISLPDLRELTVVVAGSASAQSPLETRLSNLNRQHKVKWLGHVADQALLLQLWAHSGVYVHGHSVGGTNPALLQALGAGAPTLALDTPFNREVLGSGAQDQLFPPDPAALSLAIKGLIGNTSRQRALATRGQHTVRERYSWADISQRYLAALLLAQNRAAS